MRPSASGPCKYCTSIKKNSVGLYTGLMISVNSCDNSLRLCQQCMYEWCVLALWVFVLQNDLCSVRAVIIAESDQQAGKNFKLAFS